MPTKKKTTVSKKNVNKENVKGVRDQHLQDLQELKALTAKRDSLNAQIQEILKKADTPTSQDNFGTRRRNILFFNFNTYENEQTDNRYWLSNDLAIKPYSSFDSEHDSESCFCEEDTVDDAIDRMERIIKIATDFKSRLTVAKENGCERLIDTDYCKPEEFNFNDACEDN